MIILENTYREEKTVSLRKVDNVYSDCASEVRVVLHPKIKPLEVAVAVRVISHEHIEGSLAFASDLLDVSALKIAIERDYII